MTDTSKTFEAKIKDLEAIVHKLEGELDLNEAVDAYEAGVKLVKACRTELGAIDDRIAKLEEILVTEDGEIASQPIQQS